MISLRKTSNGLFRRNPKVSHLRGISAMKFHRNEL